MASLPIHLNDNLSEFGRAAAAYEKAEAAGDHFRERLLWAAILSLVPETAHDHRWIARKLARALLNGWDEDAWMPLVRLLGNPMAVGAG